MARTLRIESIEYSIYIGGGVKGTVCVPEGELAIQNWEEKVLRMVYKV